MIDTRPPYEEVPALKRFSMHVRHGFFGRVGGVSTGVYKSLNCGPGSGDDPAKVLENRRRVCHDGGAGRNELRIGNRRAVSGPCLHKNLMVSRLGEFADGFGGGCNACFVCPRFRGNAELH